MLIYRIKLIATQIIFSLEDGMTSNAENKNGISKMALKLDEDKIDEIFKLLRTIF